MLRTSCFTLLLVGVVGVVGGCGVKTSSNAIPPKPIEEVAKSEPQATPEQVNAFIAAVKEVDTKGLMTDQVQQYPESALLYLTVTDQWAASPKREQGNTAINLRDKWKEICECFAPILVFQSQDGLELIRISAGQPKFSQD